MNPLSIYMPKADTSSTPKDSTNSSSDGDLATGKQQAKSEEVDEEDCTWFAQDDRSLQEEVEKARMGMSFFKVRH